MISNYCKTLLPHRLTVCLRDCFYKIHLAFGMTSPLRKDSYQLALVVTFLVLAGHYCNCFFMAIIWAFRPCWSFVKVDLSFNLEHFVLLPIILCLLNRVGCELNCVLDGILKLIIFHLANPVLKSLLHEIEHVLTQMINSCFQKVVTVFLKFNNFFPFWHTSLSFAIVKPCKSICDDSLSLVLQLTSWLLVLVSVVSVGFDNLTEIFV